VHDPNDPIGRLLFNVLAMIAEFEADLALVIACRAYLGFRLSGVLGGRHVIGLVGLLRRSSRLAGSVGLRKPPGDHDNPESGKHDAAQRASVDRLPEDRHPRLAARRGEKRAIVAIEHSLLNGSPFIFESVNAVACVTWRSRLTYSGPTNSVVPIGALPRGPPARGVGVPPGRSAEPCP